MLGIEPPTSGLLLDYVSWPFHHHLINIHKYYCASDCVKSSQWNNYSFCYCIFKLMEGYWIWDFGFVYFCVKFLCKIEMANQPTIELYPIIWYYEARTLPQDQLGKWHWRVFKFMIRHVLLSTCLIICNLAVGSEFCQFGKSRMTTKIRACTCIPLMCIRLAESSKTKFLDKKMELLHCRHQQLFEASTSMWSMYWDDNIHF